MKYYRSVFRSCTINIQLTSTFSLPYLKSRTCGNMILFLLFLQIHATNNNKLRLPIRKEFIHQIKIIVDALKRK